MFSWKISVNVLKFLRRDRCLGRGNVIPRGVNELSTGSLEIFREDGLSRRIGGLLEGFLKIASRLLCKFLSFFFVF